MKSGIEAVGIDLHPLATLIAKVKTTPLNHDLFGIGRDVLRSAQERVKGKNVTIPDIPRLDHWFEKHIQEVLAALIAEINSVQHKDLVDALKVAFSSIVVKVSNQESDTRYAAIRKNISQGDVWAAFDKAVGSISIALSSIKDNLFDHFRPATVITNDLMQVTPDDLGREIGLVITSPPYPNAYEYWLYHKYRMYWLGMDPVAVREREIGARPHYFKKNHQTEMDFERQMGRCFSLLSQTMTLGSYACFVVGRSVIHGRHIDNEALLERAAMPHGFRKVGQVKRRIATNRKSFNLSHGKINKEGILVFLLEVK